jgi:antitoxin ParD1/3/4
MISFREKKGDTMRTSKPLTVTLGQQQPVVDARVASGAYESASEVIRAGLRALEREEAALNDAIREKVLEAMNDPSPDIPASEVFDRLRAYHAEQLALDEYAA